MPNQRRRPSINNLHLLSFQYLGPINKSSILASIVACHHRFNSSLIPLICSNHDDYRSQEHERVFYSFRDQKTMELFMMSDTLQFSQELELNELYEDFLVDSVLKPLITTKPYFCRTLRSLRHCGASDDVLELAGKIKSLETFFMCHFRRDLIISRESLRNFSQLSFISNLAICLIDISDEQFEEFRYLRNLQKLSFLVSPSISAKLFSLLLPFKKTLQFLKVLDCSSFELHSDDPVRQKRIDESLTEFADTFSQESPQFATLFLSGHGLRNISNKTITDFFARLTSLRRLELRGNHKFEDDALRTMLSELRHLETLNVSHVTSLRGKFVNSSSDNLLKQVPPVCTNLRSLRLTRSLQNCAVPTTFIKDLVYDCPNLTKLDLSMSDPKIFESVDSVQHLAKLQHSLRALDLTRCRSLFETQVTTQTTTDDNLPPLSSCSLGASVIASLANLDHLILDDTDISNDDLIRISSHLPKLRKLNLVGCAKLASGKGIQFLCSSSACRQSLETLCLSRIPFVSAADGACGVRVVVEALNQLPSLKVLAIDTDIINIKYPTEDDEYVMDHDDDYDYDEEMIGDEEIVEDEATIENEELLENEDAKEKEIDDTNIRAFVHTTYYRPEEDFLSDDDSDY